MTRRLTRLAAVAALAASLAPGCAFKRSRPARTFVLDAVDAAAGAGGQAEPVAVVGVERVSVPGWIDRPQLTGRAGNGEVVADEFARWGEPVARGVQRVLAENLAGLLPDRRVVAAPYAARQRIDRRLVVALTEAARQADGTVLVEARWALLDADGKTVASHRFSHRVQPTVRGAAGTIAGWNEALAGLGREIAREVGVATPPALEDAP